MPILTDFDFDIDMEPAPELPTAHIAWTLEGGLEVLSTSGPGVSAAALSGG